MDRIDIAILREMTQARLILPGRPGLTPSNRAISRRLGLPPGTVRYRIRQLYGSGVVGGSSVFPNPNLLGLRVKAFTVDASPQLDKADVIEKMKLVEGVISAHDFVGSLLWAVFFYEDERALAARLKQLREIAGAEGILSSIPYPPCTASLTTPEAELILRLLKGGFDSYSGLGRETGVTVRTLERRLSKLVMEGAVLSLPKIDYAAIVGCVPADLLVLFESPEAAKASPNTVLPLVGEHVVLAALWDVAGMCSMLLPNVAAVGEVAGKVKGVRGVSMARVEIVRDHIEQFQAFEGPLVRWMQKKGFKVAPLQAQRAQARPGGARAPHSRAG